MLSYFFTKAGIQKHQIRDYAIAGITFAAVALCLFIDSNAGIERQNLLGNFAWLCLIILLYGETNSVRTQVFIAIVFATVGEHFASPYMGGYIYRFDNVPAYVPPGHGMVYLTAVALARSHFFVIYRKSITAFVLVVGGLWSIWGISFAERGDAVGALLFTVFIIFLFLGRSPRLYLAAFFITTWLELIGTWCGTWRWVPIDPVLSLPQGNPPSGVAAWYCLVDAVAIGGAPAVLKRIDQIQTRLHQTVYQHGNGLAVPIYNAQVSLYVPYDFILLYTPLILILWP